MKHLIKLSIFLFVIFVTISCNKDKAKFERLVTEKIEYDVNIKSSDSDLEWWIQNIEGPQRDKFINIVFNAVEEKKIKIFNLNQQEASL